MRTVTQHHLAPFLAMLAALFVLSTMDALIKLLTDQHGTWQIVVLRYSFGLLTISALFAARQLISRRADLNFHRRSITTSALRAVLIVLTAGSFFYALAYLPLAQAVTIAFSAPLFIVLFSRLILQETISTRTLVAIGTGFIGVLITFGNALFPLQTALLIPMLSALMASVAYGMAIVLSRKDTGHTGPMQMVVLQTGFALLFALCLALPLGALNIELTQWTPLTQNSLVLFLTIGALGSLGHVLMIWALARESAARLGSIEYTGLLWASVFGFALFGDIPSWNTLLGAILIIIGCVMAGRAQSAIERPTKDSSEL